MFDYWKQQFQSPFTDEAFLEERKRLLQQTPLPLFWLFGKTGSGKTSVIRYLTGADSASIGRGFRPETKFASRYDFPSSETPLLQFLDTRGLGEHGYDPVQDLEEFHREANLMMVTVRLKDTAQEVVLTALRQIRKKEPHRPVLLLLTCLHQTYPGQQHPSTHPPNHDQSKGAEEEEFSWLLEDSRANCPSTDTGTEGTFSGFV